MRLVVSGSREWNDKALAYAVMDDLHAKYAIEVVFHGEADGLDGIVKRWCIERGIPVFGCPYASAYDKQGGPIRNGWLLTYGVPDMVVAFPMKNSIGTWNLVTQAKARKIPIRIVKNHATH
jgi:hypothetical protein